MKRTKTCLTYLSLSTILVSSAFVYSIPSAYAQTVSQVVTDIGKEAKTYTSYNTFNNEQADNMTMSLKVTFIDDPSSDKQIAVLNTTGSFIDANTSISDKPVDGYPFPGASATLRYPSEYDVSMNLQDTSAKFFNVAPTNAVEETTVTSGVSYQLGGAIKVTDKGGEVSATGGMTWTDTVSYKQTSYKTNLVDQTNKNVKWNVFFNGYNNQNYGIYTRDSYNTMYGNQLFMYSRTYPYETDARGNLVPMDQLPALTNSGFSPGMIAVVIAEKNIEKSDVQVAYTKHSDDYALRPGFTFGVANWVGNNIKYVDKDTFDKSFTLDWKNKKLQEK
ncbi:leukocidin/hemolysin toxin family protein [Priestia taiwanensis]|uniref:Cytotoxin n=1 Tax=Priestia taiwanensis TaxID=1347902 RepID=A0A917EJZ7_9BACI|nr:leukocidin/hemolysin toxin family protein [Priestia taiwanensis]MBM7361541.1 hemolysin II [Priestia taiwanensis]GGE54998.1 cytotoxin [Priestia taiwanensis]